MGAVQLAFRDGELSGAVDGRPVRIMVQGRRKQSRVTGVFLGEDVVAEWTLGSNQNNLDPVTVLRGSAADVSIDVTATVHLTAVHFLKYVDISGAAAKQEIRVRVVPVDHRAAGPEIVEIDGTFGSARLTLYAWRERDLRQAGIQGLIGGSPNRLTASRVDGTVTLAGDYSGPSGLLHLLVGSLLHFL